MKYHRCKVMYHLYHFAVILHEEKHCPLKKTARTHLVDERKQRRWSQQEVADRLGTTRPNVSRWEAGLTNPGPYFRAKLCTLFGEQAESLYQQAMALWEQGGEPEPPRVAHALRGLGLVYLWQKKYELAEQLFLRALGIMEQALGPDHLDLSHPLNNLGNVTFYQGKYQQAEHFYQRALHLREQGLGPEHHHVGASLTNLASLYQYQGKDELAEPLLQRALGILEQVLGPDHPTVGYPLNCLAELYQLQGKYEQAELLGERAMHIWEQARGPQHPSVAYTLDNLADLYRLRGSTNKLIRSTTEPCASGNRHSGRIIQTMPSPQWVSHARKQARDDGDR